MLKKPLVKQDFLHIMTDAIETHKQRGQIYKDGYQIQAQILKILFPNGMDFSNHEAASKYVLFEFMLGKVVRYAVALDGGKGNGHCDSAHDMGIYAFLLESLHERSER